MRKVLSLAWAFSVGTILLSAGFHGNSAIADEGMWLFNQLPLQQLREKYGFQASPEWVDHVMKSSVRLNAGGSGSFVSGDGLVLTNHHVASDTLQKVSDDKHNYYKDGFYASSLEQEIKAPDLEINQLVSIEDVTARVMVAAQPGLSPGDALQAKRAEMARIEKESLERTGLRSDVVTLYNGGQYHLYRYKKYTDVRVVFAPEFDMAFFGGDPDNFEYPRYDLDMTLLRVYENGAPAKIDHFLSWSAQGPAEHDLVFVSGNPGSTSRMLTVAALKNLRDFILPWSLQSLYRLEIFLLQYSYRGPEQNRWASGMLFGIQNGRKVLMGQLVGLQDNRLLQLKLEAETALKLEVSQRPELVDTLGAWDQIAQAESANLKIHKNYSFLEGRSGIDSRLFKYARTLVRMAAEDLKPNDERLPEFRDSNRETLEQQLYSSAPIYTDFEKARLGFSLSYVAEQLGAEDPLVQKILEGKSPEMRAAELVSGSALSSVTIRKRIAKGGMNAIRMSQDAMIRLALAIDPESRAIRKTYEDQVTGPEQEAYGQIAQAMFAIYGTKMYPDATFTPRLAFGTVDGYRQNGQWIAPFTTIGGAFDYEAGHQAKEPWLLPKSWHQAKSRLNLSMPLNFVSSADIIGGNSGSPVVNTRGELVGLIFDGNIQSLVGSYVFDPAVNRSISVHSGGILEALRKVYGAEALADELISGRRNPADTCVTRHPQ